MKRDDDEYRLHEGVDQPPVAAHNHISVICGKCETLMYASEDEVGQRLRCPDCGNMVTVPPALLKKKRRPPRKGYDVAPEATPPPPIEETEPSPVCPRCHGEVQSPPPAIGERVCCRFCGESFVVLRREEEEGGEASKRQAEPPPPLWNMVWPGVLNFPFYRGCLSRWVAMALGGVVVAYTMGMALAALLAAAGAGGAMFGVCLLGFSSILLGIWLSYTSVVLLRIMEDTANGADEINNWPGAVWLDWFLEAFFVINSAALSLVPGLLLAVCLPLDHQRYWFFLGIGSFLLFPFVLLSMKEADSVFQIVSTAVLKSLVKAWRAWATLYLVSLLLFGCNVFVLWLIAPIDGLLEMSAVVTMLMATLMMYFRMLGRLTWF